MTPLTCMLAAAELPNPVDHIVGHPFIMWGEWWVWSSVTGNLVLSGLIMLLLGPWVARRIGTGPESEGDSRYLTKGRFASMIEVLTLGIRDGILEPVLGHRTKAFAPFLLVLFYFILVNNFLGLIPIMDVVVLSQHYIAKAIDPAAVTWKELHRAPVGGTATQSVWVTGALALVSFLVINISGLKEIGPVNYVKHLTVGTPILLWPIMVPVELMGIAIKPIALALRLFANMTAGHIMIAVLYFFVEMGASFGLLGLVGIGGLAGIGAIGVYLLEIFVAFLQAFIFMFLTAVFISLYEHHDEHAHEDAGVRGAYEDVERDVEAALG